MHCSVHLHLPWVLQKCLPETTLSWQQQTSANWFNGFKPAITIWYKEHGQNVWLSSADLATQASYTALRCMRHVDWHPTPPALLSRCRKEKIKLPPVLHCPLQGCGQHAACDSWDASTAPCWAEPRGTTRDALCRQLWRRTGEHAVELQEVRGRVSRGSKLVGPVL